MKAAAPMTTTATAAIIPPTMPPADEESLLEGDCEDADGSRVGLIELAGSADVPIPIMDVACISELLAVDPDSELLESLAVVVVDEWELFEATVLVVVFSPVAVVFTTVFAVEVAVPFACLDVLSAFVDDSSALFTLLGTHNAFAAEHEAVAAATTMVIKVLLLISIESMEKSNSKRVEMIKANCFGVYKLYSSFGRHKRSTKQ
ncbi:hypothetical protein BD408DRAFT_422856 [Parasitella parasitica]|nr:hypothetical protein BD408DRAFT_422856 [Parasitella parasitica]